MTDRQFDVFLENTIKNFGEDYIEFSEETIIEHTFSKRFERKMARLIRQQKSFYFPMIRSCPQSLVQRKVLHYRYLSLSLEQQVGQTAR